MLRLVLLALFTAISAKPSCSLLVAAAADLASLEQRLAGALPGCQIRFSFGSSGMLTRQIEHGADFDVFLAASKTYVDDLAAAGVVDAATAAPYARGRIGIWSRRKLDWSALRTAAVARISIANPAHAPYGLAARQALERQGLWAAVEPKIVYGENVRQAWQFAVTGNVDVTIASWSLMHDKQGQLLPASWHDPILQVAVVPKRSRNPEAARRFIAWLTSETGQKMFTAEGFDRVR